MNVVTLIGTLVTDVELRELSEDRKLATFVLAVDRQSKDGGADFVRIAVWNRQAEACSRFLGKGKRVGIDGRLRSRSWEDADGKRRSVVEVMANSVQFLSPPEGATGDPVAGRAETPFEPAAA